MRNNEQTSRKGKNSTNSATLTERHTVTSAQAQFNEMFFGSIEGFFDTAPVHQIQKTNNWLLNEFVLRFIKEGGFEEEIRSAVSLVTLQNDFIAELKDNWERFKLFNNVKID